jgi:type II secretory pathway component PulL
MHYVYVTGTPHPDRADPWVRVDARGTIVERGEAVGAKWPAGDVVVVLAAAQARLVALDMPPMSRDRLERAVRLALDDTLASDADDTAIAIGEPARGKVLVAVAEKAIVENLARRSDVVRIVPEAALTPLASDWTWYRSPLGGGFVRRDDGSAFAVGDAGAGALAPELSLALAQAARASAAPSAIRCAFACEASERSRFTHDAGVTFAPAAPWRWDGATPSVVAAAPDFMRSGARASAPTQAAWKSFRPALILAGLALAVHLGGLAVTWGLLAFENARLSRAIVSEAAAAQLPDANTPQVALAAIARQNASRRHAVGHLASSDALPLLARASSSMQALPPGTLRAAHFSGDAWTFELGPVDRDAQTRLSRALAGAGLDALAVPTSGGVRMRVALAPTAR